MSKQSDEIQEWNKETHAFRIKSAMVLYALEQSLGQYVVQSDFYGAAPSASGIDAIKERAAKKRETVKSLPDAVAASYLGEVFGFSLDVSKGTSAYEYLLDLRALCEALRIHDIRNKVSHPNRPFPEHYWHRMAAIATDPMVELLGLKHVSTQFRCAVDNRIEPPPDEWMSFPSAWAIPNNLSTEFEHDITGLVGRQKESADLAKALRNRRNSTIAVVAPGGLGKTALALNVLKELSRTPEWAESVDAIAFLSLKTERLTAGGVESLEHLETIDEVKSFLLANLPDLLGEEAPLSFAEMVDNYTETNFLVCLDNLETLLRDSQEVFMNFVDELPPNWRILVTSRVTVENAYPILVRPLSEDAATQLAREYCFRRSGPDLGTSLLAKVARDCLSNPLAVRLTLDLHISGKDLPESIGQATTNIVEFSYTNLIEILSDLEVSALECLFAEDALTRAEISSILQVSQDDAAEALLVGCDRNKA